LPIGEEGSEEAISRRGGFVAMDIDKVRLETLKWLDENIDKYIQGRKD